MPTSEPGGWPVAFDAEARAFFPIHDAQPSPPAEESGDTYLRLGALDPQDINAIARFLSAYGGLHVRGQYDYAVRPPWSVFWFPRDPVVDALEASVAHAVKARGHEAVYESDTLFETRVAILTMRDMIAAWRALQDDLDAVAHRWESPLWHLFPDHPTDSPPWGPEGPGPFLSGVLGDSLIPFSPRILLRHLDDLPRFSEPAMGGEVTAWNKCCAELYNHIVEEATYKTCANETCGRLFVRQEGRAAHGQHRRTGVKYCSATCARAQAQRLYRRRKRVAP